MTPPTIAPPATGPIPIYFRGQLTATDPPCLVSWYLGPLGPPGGNAYYRSRTLLTGTTDEVGLADLGWAVLIAGAPRYRAAIRLADEPVSIEAIPTAPLHMLLDSDRQSIAEGIRSFMNRHNGAASWLGTSLATKLVHPKRRASVPVMDNKTIYRKFLPTSWRPGVPSERGVPSTTVDIRRCLEAIYECVAAPVNGPGWLALETDCQFAGFSRIELFDMVWTAIERGRQHVAGCWS
jgi:hypothetical protein